MNRITYLTKELTEQFTAIVGRPPTAAEYFEFRNQAMKELDAGYQPDLSAESMMPSITPAPVIQQPIILNPVVQQPEDASKSILPTGSASVPVVMETLPSKKQEKTVTEQPKPVEESKPIIAAPTTSISMPSQEKEDPFFALVNKFNV